MFQQSNLNWWTRTFSPLLYHMWIKHTILNDLLLFFYKIQSRISYSFFFPHSLSDFAHFSSFQCFTMDEKRSRAVTEAFVRLYKEKLVYRYALISVEYRHYWMVGKYNALHKLFEKDMMVTIWFIIHIINLLMVFMLSQGWRNKRVELTQDNQNKIEITEK